MTRTRANASIYCLTISNHVSFAACMVFVENIKHQCAMDVDCMGITCDVLSATRPDLPEILVSFRMDPCTNDIIIKVDNKKRELSLSSVVMGKYDIVKCCTTISDE